MALLAGISVMSGRWRPQPGGKFPGGGRRKIHFSGGPQGPESGFGGKLHSKTRRELGGPKRALFGGSPGTRKWAENGPENGPFFPPRPPRGARGPGPQGARKTRFTPAACHHLLHEISKLQKPSETFTYYVSFIKLYRFIFVSDCFYILFVEGLD